MLDGRQSMFCFREIALSVYSIFSGYLRTVQIRAPVDILSSTCIEFLALM